MYDFANSGYTTVVITAVFNAYFVAVVAGGAPWATLRLDLRARRVLCPHPRLGAGDRRLCRRARGEEAAAPRSPPRAASCSPPGSRSSGRGDLWLAVALIVLSNFFFGTGENLIAAFLPELAQGEALGRVSGLGVEPRLPGRPRRAGRLPRLGHARAGAGRDGRRVRAGHDADHGGLVRRGEPPDVPRPARARAARRGTHRFRRRVRAGARRRCATRRATPICGAFSSASCSTRPAYRR